MPKGRLEKNKLELGRKFERALVVFVESPRRVLCRCDCGKEFWTNKYDLLYSRTKSCGCYNRDSTITRNKRAAVHGRSNTYEHKHWWQMVRRCTDPKFGLFEFYGEKGIRVHKDWIGPEGFLRFLDHVGESPSRRHTLDRIDNEGHYIPGNVRWATPKQQGRNKSSNKLITAFGKTLCLAEWADEMKIKATTINMRLARGWAPERALGTPVRRHV